MQKLEQDDFVGAGFRRIDHWEVHPPKINWGDVYKLWPLHQKLEYLEKLACTMNHAADKIQGERNTLNDLCVKKEEQIQSLTAAIAQNNAMIQSEITRANEEKQQFLQAIAEKNARIKELEDGDNT